MYYVSPALLECLRLSLCCLSFHHCLYQYIQGFLLVLGEPFKQSMLRCVLLGLALQGPESAYWLFDF